MPQQFPIGTGLSIIEQIRLNWRPIADGDTVEDSGRNGKILQAINFLEEDHRAERVEEDHEAHEIARLDLKLDLLLELVGQLIGKGENPPQPVTAEVGAAGLRWQAGTQPNEGQTISVELYLSELFPVPIRFAARVERVEPTAGVFSVTANYLSLDDETRDALEKLIFRRHRRRVASARRIPD